MNEKYIITRILDRTKVYYHCNEHEYYTRGNNADYSKMLDMCDSEATDELILKVARDIWEHSDMDDFLQSGGDFACFLWGFYNKCLTFNVNAE